jgi:hypothetical protein
MFLWMQTDTGIVAHHHSTKFNSMHLYSNMGHLVERWRGAGHTEKQALIVGIPLRCIEPKQPFLHKL